MITDLIYTWRTIPHRNGANPAGLTVAWGDTHVTFSTTKAAFNRALYWDYDDQLKCGGGKALASLDATIEWRCRSPAANATL